MLDFSAQSYPYQGLASLYTGDHIHIGFKYHLYVNQSQIFICTSPLSTKPAISNYLLSISLSCSPLKLMIAKAKPTFSSHLVLRIPKLRIIVPSRTCLSQKSLGVILGSSFFLTTHTQIIIVLFILSPKYLLNLFAFLPIYCHSNYPKIFSLFLDLPVFLNLPLCLLVYILEFLIIFWLKSSSDFHCCHETKVLNLAYRPTWFASCSASQPHLSPLSFLETSAL